MGAKTLEAKKKELQAQKVILQKFVDAAEALDKAMATLNKKSDELMRAQEDLYKTYQEVAAKAEAMDTGGEQAFADYKSKLIRFCNEPFDKPRPPRAEKLRGVVQKYQKSVDDEYAKWISKLETTWPKEIKKGMCFKWYVTGKIYEVISDAKQAANVNLKGDDAIWWDISIMGENKKFSINKTDLNPKKKWKYIKS